jgi:hypothetical protein
MFVRYNNVLNDEELSYCQHRVFKTATWAYGGYSRSLDDEFFWNMDLTTDDFFTKLFFEKIKKITNKNFILERVYANGATYGQPAQLHSDGREPNAYTFLFYPNSKWQPSWQGGTLFQKDSLNVSIAQYIPNSGILFKANILHSAIEHSKQFTGLRVSIAFKLKEIN